MLCVFFFVAKQKYIFILILRLAQKDFYVWFCGLFVWLWGEIELFMFFGACHCLCFGTSPFMLCFREQRKISMFVCLRFISGDSQNL